MSKWDELDSAQKYRRREMSEDGIEEDVRHALNEIDLLTEIVREIAGPGPITKDEVIDLRPISSLNLSVRAQNALAQNEVRTLQDLLSKSREDLLMFKNFGRTSLMEVESRLEGLGLALRAGFDTMVMQHGFSGNDPVIRVPPDWPPGTRVRVTRL